MEKILITFLLNFQYQACKHLLLIFHATNLTYVMYSLSFHGFNLFDPKGKGMVANASHDIASNNTQGISLIGASEGYGSGVDHASPDM